MCRFRGPAKSLTIAKARCLRRPPHAVDGPFPSPRARGEQAKPGDDALVRLIDFAREHFPLNDDDDSFCEVRSAA